MNDIAGGVAVTPITSEHRSLLFGSSRDNLDDDEVGGDGDDDDTAKYNTYIILKMTLQYHDV